MNSVSQKKQIVFLLFFCLNFTVLAQKKDSLKISQAQIDSVGKLVKKVAIDTLKKNGVVIKEKKSSDFHFFKDVFGKIDSTKRRKIPKIALFRSLIIPGWGQATNHQYWIVPVIYTAAYFSSWGVNSNKFYFGYRPFQQKYLEYRGYLGHSLETDYATTGYPIPNTTISLTSTQLTPIVNTYRRYRDLTIIGFIMGWGLQAVQANVQGHLRTFDISDNISLNFEPSFQNTPYGSATGISAKFVIK